MSADTEVAVAVLKLWRGSDSLTALVPGGLHSDRLVETQPLTKNAPRPSPYARMDIGQHKPPDYNSGGEYIDYRKVTITVYGVGKGKVGDVVSAVKQLFDNPAALDFKDAPNVVGHMRNEPQREVIEEDETKRAGEDVRRAIVEYAVWTHRTKG